MFKITPLTMFHRAVLSSLTSSVTSSDMLSEVLLSCGPAKHWKHQFVDNTIAPSVGRKYLHIASGSPDLPARIIERIRLEETEQRSDSRFRHDSGDADIALHPPLKSRVIVADTKLKSIEECQEQCLRMYRRAQSEGQPVSEGCSPEYVHLCAENPEWLPFNNEQFDSVSVAFGLHAVGDVQLFCSEALRVLRLGGKLHLLDFSSAMHHPSAGIPNAALTMVIKALALDSKSHNAQRCPAEENQLEDAMLDIGFSQVETTALGSGLASVVTATKSASEYRHFERRQRVVYERRGSLSGEEEAMELAIKGSQ